MGLFTVYSIRIKGGSFQLFFFFHFINFYVFKTDIFNTVQNTVYNNVLLVGLKHGEQFKF